MVGVYGICDGLSRESQDMCKALFLVCAETDEFVQPLGQAPMTLGNIDVAQVFDKIRTAQTVTRHMSSNEY